MANTAPPGYGVSEFARRYGTADYSSRSMLTPLFPNLLNGQLRNVSVDDFLTDQFQRECLRGFSSRELIDLGVATTKPLKASNLNNRILRFLDRDYWDEYNHHPPLLHLNGTTSSFTASNDEVWKVLKPILVLASRIFQQSYMAPFVRLLEFPDMNLVSQLMC